MRAWLAFHLGNAGERRPAAGSPGPTGSWSMQPPDCAERGLLLLPLAIQHIVTGDPAAARELSARAAGIGRDAGDDDLVALALQVQGRALVRLGRVGEAMAAFDEAMVAVVAGEPLPGGGRHGLLLDAGGLPGGPGVAPAHEWTEALTAWCGKQPEMVTFSGRCLVHRAEILHLHGAWPEAVEEAMRAGERLAQAADSWATGGAFYRQAEVYRVLGDFTAAEDAYQQASRWGLEPQPGLALLRLARAGPTRPPAGSAACLPRPPTGSGGPSSPPRSRSCSPSATSREHATPLAS